MKTLYKAFLVFAALSAVTLVSCKKDVDPYADVEDDYVAAPVETPTYADAAVVVDLSEASTPVTTKKGDKIKSIEFTESGYAIISTEEAVNIAPATKASESGGNVIVTTYTYSGGVYTVAGFGTVSITGATVTITSTGTGDDAPSGNFTGDATVTTPTGSDSDFYSSWKIYSTNVVVDGNGVKVDHLFEGSKASSLYEMAKYVNEKKNVIDENELIDYTVESVTLTKNGTFLIKFSKAPSFSGDFKLSGTSFSYELTTEGNFAFNAKADGSIKIDKETNLCVLDINGKFNSSSDNYTTKVTLKLEQLKNVN